MNSATDSDSDRIVGLEIRGLEDCHFVKTFIDDDMKKVRDLVDKLKEMIPDVRDAEDIKMYQGKYLILPDEDLRVINLNEEVIVMVAKKIYDNYNYYDNYMVFSFIRPGGQEDQLFMTYILPV